MRARTWFLGLVLSLAVGAASPTHGAIDPGSRPGPRKTAPVDRLKEALARRPGPGVLGGPESPVSDPSIASTFSSCGSWAELFGYDPTGFNATYALMVYDPVRDRMLVFIESNSGLGHIEVWALARNGSPTLTLIETQSTLGEIPDHLSGASAIYDPVRDRVVLCGQEFFDNQTGPGMQVYELTLSGTPTWSDIFPDGAYPIKRINHSAIYDQTRDRMVIFGGELLDGTSLPANDVWVMNFSGTPAWTQLSPGGSPPAARAAHTAVYDGPRDRMVVFGGGVANGLSNGAWALSLSGSGSWSQINTGAPPPPAARSGHTAIVDIPRNRMLVFGGWDDLGPLTDVWSLSLTNPIRWTQLSPSGSVSHPWGGFASAYDPARQEMVSVLGDEFWTLSNLAGTPAWTQLNPPGQVPAGRGGAVTIYDAPRQRMLMFSGFPQSGPANDLWSFSMVDGTWARIVFSSARPPRRNFSSAIYDPVADRMILFGGQGDAGPLNDTWQLSLAGTPTWTQLTPSGTPPPIRYAHTAILDAPRNRMIVNGGSDDTGTAKSDVWALSLSGGTSWTQLSPTGGPAPARQFHTAVFDVPRNRMLSFGWNDNTVWALSLAGSPAWSVVTAAGTAPPTMEGHQAAYDAVRDRMLVSMMDPNLLTLSTHELTLSGTPTWGEVGSTDPVYSGRAGGASMWDSGNDRWVIFGWEFYSNDVVALSFPATYALSVTAAPVAGGTVQGNPADECLLAGTMVTLTAVPAATYTFVGWSGDATGTTNPITVTMDAAKNIVANFDNYALNITVVPTGGGTVRRDPNLASYPPNSQVVLTAEPASGFAFVGWSGDASGTTNPLTVVMTSTKNLTATFAGYPVNVTVSPSGSGTVTKSPNQSFYPPGTQVTLTAGGGFPFLGWSGDASGIANPLVVTVDGPKNITASFEAHTVTIGVDPPGSGTVAVNPSQPFYAPGTTVTIVATPSPGSAFASWTGDLTGTNPSVEVVVDADKTATAHFTLAPAECGAWTIVPASSPPSARIKASLAWDPVRARLLMAGGDGDEPDQLSDLWALTLSPSPTWTQLAPSAIPGLKIDDLFGFYDTFRDQLLLYGGTSEVLGFPAGALFTWTLTPPYTFTSHSLNGPARFRPYVIYDSPGDRLLLFGGFERCGLSCGQNKNDLWQLTLSGPTWTQLAPAGTPPPPRNGGGAIYDGLRGRMVIFDGGGVWALNLSGPPTWTNLNATGAPHVGSGFQYAYDPIRDRAIVFDPNALNRVSMLDFKDQPNQPRWSQANIDGPSFGAWPNTEAAYVPALDAIVAFGGSPGGVITNSTIQLSLGGGQFLDAGAAANGSVWTEHWCYDPGATATALAIPAAGYEFLGWTGDATGNSNPVQITMDSYKVIQAQFGVRTTGVDGPALEFALNVRPNPSPTDVRIEYILPREAGVRLRVYDVAGREVARLADGVRPAGRHTVNWNGGRGSRRAAALYLVRLESALGTRTRRVVMLK